MPRPAKRITIIRGGKPRRTFIVPPHPDLGIGSLVELDGLEYIVIVCEDEEVLMDIPMSAKAEVA
jgi:hypothetical protein